MPLNKSVGNMYSWVTHTWNPIRGCEHNCSYCYIRSRKNYSMKPRFVAAELKTNLGSDNFIFIGSMADMFGKWVNKEWILKVLKHCSKFESQYLFQSKNPYRFIEFHRDIPKNSILGTTIETNRATGEFSEAPYIVERMQAMTRDFGFRKEVTIEPIMDFDTHILSDIIRAIRPDFVSIGADSKGHGLPEPSAYKVKELITRLSKFTEVKLKKNLSRILGYKIVDRAVEYL